MGPFFISRTLADLDPEVRRRIKQFLATQEQINFYTGHPHVIEKPDCIDGVILEDPKPQLGGGTDAKHANS